MYEQGIAGGNEKSVDLIFEAGGVKGIGLVGAYHVLKEHGYHPENMAGASAGAIVAALVASGYSATELYDIMKGLDFDQFKTKASEYYSPFSSSTSRVEYWSPYKGEALFYWIDDLLDAQGVRTFGDLTRRPDTDDLLYRYKLQVIVSDLTERQMLVLPRDAEKLGYRHADNLEVALAVRMSMSIPLFFEPVTLINQETGREHILVDGRILSNFPVWLFDAYEPQWPTWGIRLTESDPRAPLAKRATEHEVRRSRLPRTVDFLLTLVETMMEPHERLYIEQSDFDRTIAIDPLGIGTTEFELSRQPERVRALYESGRLAAEKPMYRY